MDFNNYKKNLSIPFMLFQFLIILTNLKLSSSFPNIYATTKLRPNETPRVIYNCASIRMELVPISKKLLSSLAPKKV